MLERCCDWDNLRAAAVVCDLQFEFDEELRCQFGHLLNTFPLPPQRTINQTDLLVATALELASVYSVNNPGDRQRTLLIMHVRLFCFVHVLCCVQSVHPRQGTDREPVPWH